MIEITSLSACFPRGWAKRRAKRKGAGQCEKQRLAMYVSLHSPASAAAYASCRGTLPLAKREGLYLYRAFRHGHLMVYERKASLICLP